MNHQTDLHGSEILKLFQVVPHKNKFSVDLEANLTFFVMIFFKNQLFNWRLVLKKLIILFINIFQKPSPEFSSFCFWVTKSLILVIISSIKRTAYYTQNLIENLYKLLLNCQENRDNCFNLFCRYLFWLARLWSFSTVNGIFMG